MAIPGDAWQVVDGWAVDIAVGGLGLDLVVYHTGHDQEIYQWNGSYGWIPVNCRGKAIAAGPEGDLWFTGLEKGVFRRDRTTGAVREYGDMRGTDIGVGKDGVPWVCYYLAGLTYRGIWRWNFTANKWDEITGYASRIAGGDGHAWHVGGDGRIFRWANEDWHLIDGWAQDIGVGHNDDAWHVGTEDRIYYRDGNNWVQVFGEAKRISIGPRGLPWIVTDKGWILRRV
jgi:hypothetical protein